MEQKITETTHRSLRFLEMTSMSDNCTQRYPEQITAKTLPYTSGTVVEGALTKCAEKPESVLKARGSCEEHLLPTSFNKHPAKHYISTQVSVC